MLMVRDDKVGGLNMFVAPHTPILTVDLLLGISAHLVQRHQIA